MPDQIEEIPNQEPTENAPEERPVYEVRSNELKRLANYNNCGEKENWEAETRLRPRKRV